MAEITIKGPASGTVTPILTPRISVADTWGGDWAFLPDAIFVRCLVSAVSKGMSQLEFELPYGSVLSAVEGPPFRALDSQDLQGSWVKLDLVDPEGSVQVAFVGQVRGEDREIMGSDAHGPTGVQKFTATGGEILLALCAISHGFWLGPPTSGGGSTQSSGGVVELGWSPDFNVLDPQGFLVGNRSSSAVDGSFVFGGRSIWTRRNAIDYVLARFVNKLKGPTWTLGGQLDALDLPVEDVPIGLTTTAFELLKRLLPREAGLDYVVLPSVDADGTPDGFEIRVFSLFGSNVQFNGAQLSANKSIVRLNADEADLEKVLVAIDTTSAVSKVRVLGARIVMCATLQGTSGPSAGSGGTTSTPSLLGSFVGLWTSDQETAYKLALGTAVPEDNDTARESLTTGVYQKFGPPSSFVIPPAWRPVFDGKGEPGDGAADWQNKVRELLDWIPMLGADGHPRRPLVIARDRRPEVAAMTSPSIAPPNKNMWVQVHQLHVGVSVLQNVFGLELAARPPHRLARGLFDTRVGGTSPSAFLPWDDYEAEAVDPTTLAATVAWRMDQRLTLEATLPGQDDDGTVYEVPAHHAERAELWVVAKGTITDVINGTPSFTADQLVVRNDADRIASFMAGLVARFLAGRQRAVASWHGWKPRLSLIGQILETVEQGGQRHGVNAPITSVELEGGRNNESPRTIVRAGFAS